MPAGKRSRSPGDRVSFSNLRKPHRATTGRAIDVAPVTQAPKRYAALPLKPNAAPRDEALI